MKAVIFDLDGTLADITHRLHLIKGGEDEGGTYKKEIDWDEFNRQCVNDSVHEDIRTLLHLFFDNGYEIIICSARGSEAIKETKKWLTEFNIPHDLLLMRAAGDYRPDEEIKREMLHSIQAENKYDIQFVVDDRRKVVDMWREEGLRCLHVAKGEF